MCTGSPDRQIYPRLPQKEQAEGQRKGFFLSSLETLPLGFPAQGYGLGAIPEETMKVNNGLGNILYEDRLGLFSLEMALGRLYSIFQYLKRHPESWRGTFYEGRE